MESRWKPVEHTSDDFKGIAALRENFESTEAQTSRRAIGPGYYQWKLRQNPVALGSCMIAVPNESTNPVGLATITPKTFIVDRKPVRSAEIGDTFTHTSFQRQGIFSAMVFGAKEAAIRSGIDFIYGTPNNQSLPGYQKKCNFDVVPSARVNNYVLPLNAGAVLGTRIKSRMVTGIVGPLIQVILSLIVMLRTRGRASGAYQIDQTSEFPKGLVDVILKAAQRFDVILDRNPGYLSWRFCTNPDKYKIFTISGTGKPVGYFVLKDGYWSGLKVGYVADFLVDPEDPKAVDAALAFICRFFKQEGMDMVACWMADGPFSPALRRHGFFVHKNVPLICFKNTVGEKIIDANHRWHFTLADSDNI